MDYLSNDKLNIMNYPLIKPKNATKVCYQPYENAIPSQKSGMKISYLCYKKGVLGGAGCPVDIRLARTGVERRLLLLTSEQNGMYIHFAYLAADR